VGKSQQKRTFLFSLISLGQLIFSGLAPPTLLQNPYSCPQKVQVPVSEISEKLKKAALSANIFSPVTASVERSARKICDFSAKRNAWLSEKIS